jgi:hypothetical protein
MFHYTVALDKASLNGRYREERYISQNLDLMAAAAQSA